MSRRKQRNPQQLISPCQGFPASENGALRSRGARGRPALAGWLAPGGDAGDSRPPDTRGPCCRAVGGAAHARRSLPPPPPPPLPPGAAEMSSPRGRGEPAEGAGAAAAGASMAEPAGDPGDDSSPFSCPSCHTTFKEPSELSAHTSTCFSERAPSSAGPATTPAAGQEHSSVCSSSSSSIEVHPESSPSMDVEPEPLLTEPSQESASSRPPPPPPPTLPPSTTLPTGHLNIPLILEELRVLQQRQLHQMQMTEQICRQVLLLSSWGQVGAPAPTTEPAPVASVPPKPPLPVFSIKTEPGRSQVSASPDVPKPAFFHLYHPFPGGTRVPKAEQLLAPAFPTATGILAAQCLGTARSLEQATSPGLLRQKNGGGGGGVEANLEGEKPSGRHKCRFCGKIFGSDSALQIHLRSHTGERPYKCNICGNRFTTRGNLKVHFHRHREKYPHVQMNPHPVPEHLDYVLTTSGLPYGMSVPPEKAESGEEHGALPVAERKALSATESLTLLSGTAPSAAAQALPSFNKLVLMKAVEAKGRGDENTPPESEAEGARLQLGKLVGALPSWALLANHFKAGPAVGPFPYVLEASPSETSKLQQLVEKIDRQGSPSSSGAAFVAPSIAGSSASSSLASSGPNQCVICLRVLSCPRALQLHYGQHGGERPFKCKVCGRAFSTRGNLRAHFVGHKTSPSARAQNSCPICQKKFTNAVSLQQHVRMHLGGQIPNGALLPEPSAPEGVPLGEGEKPREQPSAPQEEELSEEEEEEEEPTDEDSVESIGEKAEQISSPEGLGPPKEGEEMGQPEGEEGGPGAPSSSSPLGPQSPLFPLKDGEEKTDMEEEGGGTVPVEEDPEKDKGEGGGEGPSDKQQHQGSQAKEEPVLICGICKQPFTDRAALRKHAMTAHPQVHLGSHVWSNNQMRRGRRLPLEGPLPVLSGGQVKLQDFLGRDIPAQLVGVGPLSFWNQYTAFVSGGLPAKPAHSTAASVVSSSSSSSSPNVTPQSLFGSSNVPGKVAPAEAKEKPPVTNLLLLSPPAAPVLETVPENQGKGEK